MKTITWALAALCLCIGHADAAIMSQTNAVPTHTPDGAYALTFNQFSEAKGTLTAVEIIFSVSMYGGSVSVDNDSENPQTATATIRAISGLTSSDVFLTADRPGSPWTGLETKVSKDFELAATFGGATDPDNQYNNTGQGDWAEYSGPSESEPLVVEASDFVRTADHAGYIGTGTYVINFGSVQSSTATGQGVAYAVTPLQAHASVIINYHYTPIPEPATGALAGVAGLLLLLRRRRA